MAVNFLIALATAIGSATVILLAIIGALKIFKPKSFAETIPQSREQTARGSQGPIQTPALPAYHVIDTATLLALSGEQIASLVVSQGGQSAQLLLIAEAVQGERKNRAARFSFAESLRGKQSDQTSAQQAPDEVVCALAG